MTGEDSIPDATHSCHTKPPLWTGIGLFGPYYSLFLAATWTISESDDDLLNRVKGSPTDRVRNAQHHRDG